MYQPARYSRQQTRGDIVLRRLVTTGDRHARVCRKCMSPLPTLSRSCEFRFTVCSWISSPTGQNAPGMTLNEHTCLDTGIVFTALRTMDSMLMKFIVDIVLLVLVVLFTPHLMPAPVLVVACFLVAGCLPLSHIRWCCHLCSCYSRSLAVTSQLRRARFSCG